jgi:alanine-glyoxylate transaminase / serine-glyoxylate transaminase / serine-pyruvate transaminase
MPCPRGKTAGLRPGYAFRMSILPTSERLLLGPGPSMISPRVMRALGAPVLGHLDPDLLAMMDEMRDQLRRLFRAPAGSFTLAVPGTGTSGLEAAVANLVQDGTRVLAVVTGYFGDRLAQVCRRYGGRVSRIEVEWGRACDPQQVRDALAAQSADVVCVVHAETSTGVRNPVEAIARAAHDAGALVLVDAVTSLGGHPFEMEQWQIDAAYSCTQKCVGAPSGLSPVAFGPSALARRVPCRSFYLDLGLLEDYWVRHKYHHTLSSSLVCALHEALNAIDEEGLDARWARHERHHRALASALAAMGLGLLPPEGERLWTLNAVRVPDGVDEARARKDLLTRFNMEIGSGLGPLAGRIWRVGLMGHSSSPQALLLFLGALESVLSRQGFRVPAGAGTAAAIEALNG